MQSKLFTIELTPEETTLAVAIDFDPHAMLGNTQAFHVNSDLVAQLTNSLLRRNEGPAKQPRGTASR